MKVVSLHEHASCYNHEKGNKATIEKLQIAKGEEWEKFLVENKIVFILEGRLRFSFGEYIDQEISEGKMMVLPCGYHYSGFAEEDVDILICRLRIKVQLCDRLSLKDLYNKNQGINIGYIPLDIHERILPYIHNLDIYISDGIGCVHFFHSKLKELFYLLRYYYTREDLMVLFYPMLSDDGTFSDFIFKNYDKVKTVKDFADLANYSISGFEKRFKKAFGVSAYQWMKEKRAKSIYHELKTSEKPIKQICWEYGFSSPSHFNDFCKTHFGLPPGHIRNRNQHNAPF